MFRAFVPGGPKTKYVLYLISRGTSVFVRAVIQEQVLTRIVNAAISGKVRITHPAPLHKPIDDRTPPYKTYNIKHETNIIIMIININLEMLGREVRRAISHKLGSHDSDIAKSNVRLTEFGWSRPGSKRVKCGRGRQWAASLYADDDHDGRTDGGIHPGRFAVLQF